MQQPLTTWEMSPRMGPSDPLAMGDIEEVTQPTYNGHVRRQWYQDGWIYEVSAPKGSTGLAGLMALLPDAVRLVSTFEEGGRCYLTFWQPYPPL